MDGYRFNASADELGIVTELRANRAKWAKRQRKTPSLDEEIRTTMKRMVRAAVTEQIKAEVDAIVAARMDQLRAELEKFSRPTGPAIECVLGTVCEVTGISLDNLLGPHRSPPYAYPRMLAYHVLRVSRASDMSLPAIGRALGGRDHTSVMHGLKVFASKANDQPFAGWLADPRIAALLERPAQ